MGGQGSELRPNATTEVVGPTARPNTVCSVTTNAFWERLPMSNVSIRYMISDVPAAVRFYTSLLGFTLERDASPAFASVARDGVRLLLSGDGSSGKRPLPDGREQLPGGWNRIHLEVADLAGEVDRLRAAGVSFRMGDIVTGPGGAQIILDDPSGNPVELFQPASHPAA